jgi:hypothetical protein
LKWEIAQFLHRIFDKVERFNTLGDMLKQKYELLQMFDLMTIVGNAGFFDDRLSYVPTTLFGGRRRRASALHDYPHCPPARRD